MAKKFVVADSGITREALEAEAVELFATASGLIKSEPPSGKKKVTNIYYDPELDLFVVEREE